MTANFVATMVSKYKMLWEEIQYHSNIISLSFRHVMFSHDSHQLHTAIIIILLMAGWSLKSLNDQTSSAEAGMWNYKKCRYRPPMCTIIHQQTNAKSQEYHWRVSVSEKFVLDVVVFFCPYHHLLFVTVHCSHYVDVQIKMVDVDSLSNKSILTE